MKRSLKNVIVILLIIILGVGSYFTMKSVQKDNTSNENKEMLQGSNMGELPTKPGESNSNNSSNTQENNMSEPPAKPEGENNQTPPEMQNTKQEEKIEVDCKDGITTFKVIL